MLPFPRAHWLVLFFLLLTFAAFMPSYFAVLPTAPWVHHLHGITATLWVVLLATQNWTAHHGKWNWHVRSGTASMALVPAFTVGGLLVTHHMLRTESLFNELFGQALSVADLVVSAAFVTLYTLALRNRRTPDLHARYMLATVILLIGPSLSRFLANYVPGFLVRSVETLPNLGKALDTSFVITAAFCLFLILRDRANGKPIAPFVGALIATVAMFLSYHVIGNHAMYVSVAAWIAGLPVWQVVLFGLVTSTAAVAWAWFNPRNPNLVRAETGGIKGVQVQKVVLATGLIAFLGALANDALAQDRLPIIDMHLHSYDERTYAAFPDQFGEMAPPSVEAHFDATYDSLRRHNVVLGVVSGSVASEEAWIENDEDGRLLRGFNSSNLRDVTPEAFEALVRDGKVDVFGEIGAFYQGKTLADPLYDPYLKICEEYGIPVAVHTGGGPPGTTGFAPEARLELGNPLLIEDVLLRYPNLKIYIMHSGAAWFREALQLMLSHPQVYSDLGVVLWVHPAPMFYGREFLVRAKEFGMLDRVMFGSDQMMWPHGIDASIERLESFDFLTEEETRDILYNNAARFLGLSEEQIAQHHSR